MIKKTTKIVFEETGDVVEDARGIPLSEGERLILTDRVSNAVTTYVVAKKDIRAVQDGDDFTVDITYTLRKAP